MPEKAQLLEIQNDYADLTKILQMMQKPENIPEEVWELSIAGLKTHRDKLGKRLSIFTRIVN